MSDIFDREALYVDGLPLAERLAVLGTFRRPPTAAALAKAEAVLALWQWEGVPLPLLSTSEVVYGVPGGVVAYWLVFEGDVEIDAHFTAEGELRLVAVQKNERAHGPWVNWEIWLEGEAAVAGMPELYDASRRVYG